MSEQAGLLRDEYLFLLGQYEAFDGKALTIKSWSSPLLGGGIVLAVDKASVGIALATAVVATTLWILEAIWKNFQFCYRDRIELLERWFRSEIAEAPAPFQVHAAWQASVHRFTRNPPIFVKLLLRPFVLLPYLPILAAAVVVMVLV
jgi:hypothetical protein